jgi:hypothetical protein
VRIRDDGGSSFEKEDAVGTAIVVVVAGAAAGGASQAGSAGPYLTFAAAVLVALVTWFATDRRQARQLLAEEKRQAASLAADASRQARELAHDRKLRDLDHLRAALSAAAVAYEDAVLAMARFENKDLANAIDVDPHTAFRTAAGHMSRLQLWLPLHGEIVTNYVRAVGSLQSVLELFNAVGLPLDANGVAKRDELMGRAGSAWNAHLLAGLSLVGAVLPDDLSHA